MGGPFLRVYNGVVDLGYPEYTWTKGMEIPDIRIFDYQPLDAELVIYGPSA